MAVIQPDVRRGTSVFRKLYVILGNATVMCSFCTIMLVAQAEPEDSLQSLFGSGYKNAGKEVRLLVVPLRFEHVKHRDGAKHILHLESFCFVWISECK